MSKKIILGTVLVFLVILSAGCTWFEGPIGETGPQGEAGPQGIQGAQGIDGRDGKDGKDGTPGAIGPQGPMGPIGPAGEDGLCGVEALIKVFQDMALDPEIPADQREQYLILRQKLIQYRDSQ